MTTTKETTNNIFAPHEDSKYATIELFVTEGDLALRVTEILDKGILGGETSWWLHRGHGGAQARALKNMIEGAIRGNLSGGYPHPIHQTELRANMILGAFQDTSILT